MHQGAVKTGMKECATSIRHPILQKLTAIITSHVRADFWGGDATKHFSVKKGVFSEKGGGDSVNEGFGKDLYRKGNSVKRSGRFSEPPDSEK